MTYAVEIERVESRPIAVVRRRAGLKELSTVVPDACGTVWNIVKALPNRAGAGRNLALYLDEMINLEVGVEIDGSFSGSGEVVRSATPAGRALTTVHFGPYDRLPLAHQAIRDWAALHHEALAGPNWEIYGHWTDDSSKLRTDVVYLLKA
jgi:effector-binding domain-containing protein